jgi:hypothetical protein
MRRSYAMLIAVPLLAALASGAAPWRSLPPCVIGKWSGITATDEAGNVIGSADPADWGCLSGTAGPATPVRSLDDPVPAPPPPGICFYPAAPNPTSGTTRMRFTLLGTSRVSLVVYGKKGHGPHNAFPVRTLVDADLVAGAHEVLWDGADDHGARLAPGLYRVAMTVGEGSLCGDVEIR